MASRMVASRFCLPTSRAVTLSSQFQSRSFQTSSTLLQEVATAAPVRKPVGAFRGGLFGFLLGSTLASASVYYYILEEYKVSNEMLTEDIYALQAATQRIYAHVSEIENKMAQSEKKRM